MEVTLAGVLDGEVGRCCRPERKERTESRQDSWEAPTSSNCLTKTGGKRRLRMTRLRQVAGRGRAGGALWI